MSTYPFLNQVGSVSDLPADWFERGPARGQERGLIAETGWLATPLCTVLDVFRGQPVAGVPEVRFLNEVLLKAFGTMGLRRYDGTPRPGHLAAWQMAR